MKHSQNSRPLSNGPQHYVQVRLVSHCLEPSHVSFTGCAELQIAELGHGTFGMVVKALDMRTKPPTEVAIKMLPRGDFVSSRCLRPALQLLSVCLPVCAACFPLQCL